jgi:hypothetical protein
VGDPLEALWGKYGAYWIPAIIINFEEDHTEAQGDNKRYWLREDL